ncbi:SDR family NAD(P)-dependent oxidoreductase [Dictyobacter formicarum]|nr:SDR family NAD(P)-dependent oxidoreductase [Dictyobacter formicarum]
MAVPHDADALAWEAARQGMRAQLRELLPSSYGIGSGPINNSQGQSSRVPDIVIYDQTRATSEPSAAGSYSLKSVLAILQFSMELNLTGPDSAMEVIRSVKHLQPYRVIPIVKKEVADLSTRTERIPKQAFPVGIVLARGSLPELEHEERCRHLAEFISQYELGERPDYIYLLDWGVYYRNPALDGRGLKGYELSICREPDHQNAESCYVCKERFFRQHFYYPHMCPRCGDLNYVKRRQTADLRGYVALITGGRLRIGQAAVLKLLRAGATVIVTTRFPHDAARRYASQPDFADWCERLEIYGLDLRQLSGIQRCTAYIQQQYGRLDILINNAAQTVRRPPAFYAHLLEFELLAPDELPAILQPLLKSEQVSMLPPVREREQWSADQQHISIPSLSAERSAALSQIPLIAGDELSNSEHFPPATYDQDGQQLDLRTENSWTMRLQDLSIPEIVEVQLVNSIAPTVLIQQLTPLLRRTQDVKQRPTHIINVSAIEGQFAGHKTGAHPHTNMAKAALNMLTLTMATDLAAEGVAINSVDPGWISQQVPYGQRIAEDKLPLDEVDAAARICDLIFGTAQGGQITAGKFWKDYLVAPW